MLTLSGLNHQCLKPFGLWFVTYKYLEYLKPNINMWLNGKEFPRRKFKMKLSLGIVLDYILFFLLEWRVRISSISRHRTSSNSGTEGEAPRHEVAFGCCLAQSKEGRGETFSPTLTPIHGRLS